MRHEGRIDRRQIGSVLDLELLGDISCPTLIVAGADDRLRSLHEARELHEGIPGSTLAVIKGAGHLIPLERPASLADVVDQWLAGVLGDQTS